MEFFSITCLVCLILQIYEHDDIMFWSQRLLDEFVYSRPQAERLVKTELPS